ncbi:hypothetical protein [Ottowia sp.]|uniref:hypothetical protein n=1 Tax=Ottowia sp. TaxID=1898956 RepID=UPI002BEFD739|nr:hypothetical protein [Ottowia sp.]HOB66006.1 hypothetical protein [Ottowia sp.]HPZ56116.1 hypothetical protein [Ottowia sp.]HQD46746.1 hypothetical protein [Ottowia sp.]
MNPTHASIHIRHLAAAAAIAAAVVLAFSVVVGHRHVTPVSAAEVQAALEVLAPPNGVTPAEPVVLRN